jgi:NAD(P)-dependent dehydrogenase (short-subunit alcohol dehydrogenase family)
MKLMDRIAVVTGAGSGIGRATALMFAREGARVAVVDLAEATAKATAEEIERAGGQALAMRADVLNTPDDLAKVAVFLASDDAAMITGTCVEVDGGRCI